MVRETNKLVISLRYAPIILPMNHNNWAHNGNGIDYTNNDLWDKPLKYRSNLSQVLWYLLS